MPPKLLILDSGAGGLTVAREIALMHPQCELVYVADNAGFPYGELADDALVTRLQALLAHLCDQTCPDILILACNTASTIALEHLRKMFSMPIVGVVPAIKPAASLTKTGAIGVLATPATVNRPYTQQLIQTFASRHRVYLYGSTRLVELAESSLWGSRPATVDIAAELQQLLGQAEAAPIDTVVLACTHFPLLISGFKDLPQCRDIQWVDSGNAIARRVGQLLADNARQTHPSSRINLVFTRQQTESTAAYQTFLEGLDPTHPREVNLLDLADSFSNR